MLILVLLTCLQNASTINYKVKARVVLQQTVEGRILYPAGIWYLQHQTVSYALVEKSKSTKSKVKSARRTGQQALQQTVVCGTGVSIIIFKTNPIQQPTNK